MSKRIKSLLVSILAVMMPIILLSCGDEKTEEIVNEISLSDYIVGSWHSYQLVVYANQQSITQEVTKAGEASFAYYDMAFKNDGSVVIGYWAVDSNGLSRWKEADGRYFVNNDIVTIFEEQKPEESVDLLYDAQSRTLMLRLVLTINGVQATTNIFLKK